MGKFDGYLLVSDFDGTLIDHNLSISDENTAAIRSFIDQGGRFLGATGRTATGRGTTGSRSGSGVAANRASVADVVLGS